MTINTADKILIHKQLMPKLSLILNNIYKKYYFLNFDFKK